MLLLLTAERKIYVTIHDRRKNNLFPRDSYLSRWNSIEVRNPGHEVGERITVAAQRILCLKAILQTLCSGGNQAVVQTH